ncbi:hypothetical protein J6590_032310 [Homalodisca vitripennis]|nr:hypothetical protein J6590_032310 [Homalodisca vitripennis]
MQFTNRNSSSRCGRSVEGGRDRVVSGRTTAAITFHPTLSHNTTPYSPSHLPSETIPYFPPFLRVMSPWKKEKPALNRHLESEQATYRSALASKSREICDYICKIIGNKISRLVQEEISSWREDFSAEDTCRRAPHLFAWLH